MRGVVAGEPSGGLSAQGLGVGYRRRRGPPAGLWQRLRLPGVARASQTHSECLFIAATSLASLTGPQPASGRLAIRAGCAACTVLDKPGPQHPQVILKVNDDAG